MTRLEKVLRTALAVGALAGSGGGEAHAEPPKPAIKVPEKLTRQDLPPLLPAEQKKIPTHKRMEVAIAVLQFVGKLFSEHGAPLQIFVNPYILVQSETPLKKYFVRG